MSNGMKNFSLQSVRAAKNFLISALSDYESNKEIFWKIFESEFFHCESIGGVSFSSSKGY